MNAPYQRVAILAIDSYAAKMTLLRLPGASIKWTVKLPTVVTYEQRRTAKLADRPRLVRK